MNTAFSTRRRAARFLTCLATFGILACVSGCAGEQVSKSSTASDLVDKGIAIVSVTHNMAAGSRVEAIFYVDSSELSKQRLLRSVESVVGIPIRSDFSDAYGQVYVLALPPGVHKIERWRVTSGPLYLSPQTALQPLEFSVRAGEVIYLGNLHMNIRLSGGLPADAVPQIRDRREVDLLVAATKAPTTKGHAEAKLLPLGAWQ